MINDSMRTDIERSLVWFVCGKNSRITEEVLLSVRCGMV